MKMVDSNSSIFGTLDWFLLLKVLCTTSIMLQLVYVCAYYRLNPGGNSTPRRNGSRSVATFKVSQRKKGFILSTFEANLFLPRLEVDQLSDHNFAQKRCRTSNVSWVGLTNRRLLTEKEWPWLKGGWCILMIRYVINIAYLVWLSHCPPQGTSVPVSHCEQCDKDHLSNFFFLSHQRSTGCFLQHCRLAARRSCNSVESVYSVNRTQKPETCTSCVASTGICPHWNRMHGDESGTVAGKRSRHRT